MFYPKHRKALPPRKLEKYAEKLLIPLPTSRIKISPPLFSKSSFRMDFPYNHDSPYREGEGGPLLRFSRAHDLAEQSAVDNSRLVFQLKKMSGVRSLLEVEFCFEYDHPNGFLTQAPFKAFYRF